MRGIGATLFFFGGVIPLAWFMATRWVSLKKVRTDGSIDDIEDRELEKRKPASAPEVVN